MPRRLPLTLTEKERIYQGKLAGCTLAALATELHCSAVCVRKWWRRGRDHGLKGLPTRHQGRRATGLLSHFGPRVVTTALALKRQHPGWGAQRVRVELEQTSALAGAALPHRSQLAAFFRSQCPDCVAGRHPRPATSPRPLQVTGVHEQWQLDSQEGIALQDHTWATICNVRDPVGAAMLASQAFTVTTARHWRKLDWTEVRAVLRQSFTEWQTLPDEVQTDNELGLAGAPTDVFPSHLTLWLRGLGVTHRFIRPGQPTDQPQIERNHRTLDGLTLDEQALQNQSTLQSALDRERHVYNAYFPSQASDCAGRPPLQAHPELLRPRRPYQPDHELALFDITRVYAYLSTFRFERKVNTVGQVSLGRQLYSVGRGQAGRTVQVHFDRGDRTWVFQSETEEEFARRPLKHLTIETLTGLTVEAPCAPFVIQLTLPCFTA